MGFFDRSNESASPIGLLRAHIGTFMYCVKMGKKKFQNKEDIGDIFFDMDQTKFLLDQATRGSLYDFDSVLIPLFGMLLSINIRKIWTS